LLHFDVRWSPKIISKNKKKLKKENYMKLEDILWNVILWDGSSCCCGLRCCCIDAYFIHARVAARRASAELFGVLSPGAPTCRFRSMAAAAAIFTVTSALRWLHALKPPRIMLVILKKNRRGR
jgi:hypothetical protein